MLFVLYCSTFTTTGHQKTLIRHRAHNHAKDRLEVLHALHKVIFCRFSTFADFIFLYLRMPDTMVFKCLQVKYIHRDSDPFPTVYLAIFLECCDGLIRGIFSSAKPLIRLAQPLAVYSILPFHIPGVLTATTIQRGISWHAATFGDQKRMGLYLPTGTCAGFRAGYCSNWRLDQDTSAAKVFIN